MAITEKGIDDMENRAFTVVELLAVLIVLAVILAITIPTITGVIEKSRREAFKSDARLVLTAIDYKKLIDTDFDSTTVNQNNISELLSLSNANYFTVKIKMAGDIPAITILGKEKWSGLVACGTFQNMSVVQSTSDCTTDLIAPIITLLGTTPVTIDAGDVYIDAGATAFDDKDGDITNKIVVTGTVNVNVPGVYTITYSVTDSSFNSAEISRTVNVVDHQAPSIIFNPSGNSVYARNRDVQVSVIDTGGILNDSLKYLWKTSNVEPLPNEFNLVFNNNQIVSTPSNVTGGYYLWVIASDVSNNSIISGSEVFNLDNTKPVITINGDSSVTINKDSIYNDLGATSLDNIDGNISVTSSGTVNPSIVGSYTITYSSVDSSGNIADPVIRTINVIDVLSPSITILGANPLDMDVGTSYVDPGVIAYDDVDGDITNRIETTSNLNPNIGGTYTVTYTVSDTAGNQSVAARSVRVYVTWYQTRTIAPAAYYANYTASSNTTYSCPPGYSSSGSGSSMTCYTTSTSYTSNIATTTYSCPSGYNSSGSGSSMTCSRTATTSPSTTSGSPYCSESSYSIVGSNCSRTVSCSGCSGQGVECMNQKCGAGGYDNASWSCGASTCTATMAIRYSCSTGTNNSVYQSTCYYCPSGYNSSGTGSSTSCSRNESTSNIATTTYSCPSGYNSSGSGSSMICYTTSTSYTSNIATTTYSCPSGGTLSGTTCLRNYYQCSSGTLSGTSCYGGWSSWTTTPATNSETLEVRTEKRLTSS